MIEYIILALFKAYTHSLAVTLALTLLNFYRAFNTMIIFLCF